MRVTWGHFSNKERLNATLQYPHEKWPIPERHIGFVEKDYNVIRSRLHVDIDDCIGCLQCERACPVDCIKIETIKVPKDVELGSTPGSSQTSTTSNGTNKRLLVGRFTIDMAECCYCNLCVYPCPEECIYMVGGPNMDKHPIDYEFAVRDRNGLVYEFDTATDEEVTQIAQLAGVADHRAQRTERLEQMRQAVLAPVPAAEAVTNGEEPVAAPPVAKPKKVITEPKMDLAVLGAIGDRVTRGLAKKAAMKAVRAGRTSTEVAEQVKAALEEGGKLTPEVADIVAGLAKIDIQQPGGAEEVAVAEAGVEEVAGADTEAEAKRAAPEPVADADATPKKETAPAASGDGGKGKVDLTILNGIGDRLARGKAKAILSKVTRQGGTPKDAAEQIRTALTELGKLDDEVEAILARLEG
ncbi:MAG: 4Fe-4S binding protein [Candidatus Marinimicrobia bacterium]|nr:4Fe-4S binding protein [Candidatus Neomarinimicrobiota bacterium]